MKAFMKKACLLLIVATVLVGMFSIGASGYEAYKTYTFDIDGNIVDSPATYSAGLPYDAYSTGLYSNFGLKMNNATDIFADSEGFVYVVENGNAATDKGRVIVLDRTYKAIAVIESYTDEFGRPQSLNKPAGLFVTDPELTAEADDKKEIYVCDTENKRIVVFDETYAYKRTIECPNHSLLKKEKFHPIAIAVDKYGRIFVVSDYDSSGVIVLSADGKFTGFIGASKLTGTVWQRIKRRFTPKDALNDQGSASPVNYANITVDENGFIYVCSKFDTTLSEERLGVLKSKDASKSPVKKLNSSGAEIMNRNGFFDPSGEVTNFQGDLSSIVDIAVGPEGTWSILDSTRSRIYTYSANGELLHAFGGLGDSLGMSKEPGQARAITYQKKVEDGKVSYVLLMLNTNGSAMQIHPFTPTPYCETILDALAHENRNEYEDAQEYWQEVKTKNNNFDLAYIGIGKALYSQGKYVEAMEILEKAYEIEYYAVAYQETLSSFISGNLLWLLIAVVVLFVALSKFLGYAKRKNKATSLKVGRKSYGEELLYVFHLIFHPFDGFWDLKHEKRGSMRAAWTILGITAVMLFYNSIGKAYLFNPRGNYTMITASTIGLILLVFLWVTGNWGLTSLFDGEGSYKDVFIATCYSIAPMSFIYFVCTLLTNVMTDGGIINLLLGIGFAWTGFLLFFGMLVTHDYTLGKNLLITVCTIVAMVIIMFVALLFTTLVTKMFSFLVTLITEIGDRI